MPTRNINLTPHFDAFIQSQVTSGQYGNASEIVRDALRMLEEREQEKEAKLRVLRTAAKIGFDSIDQGEGIVLNGKAEIDEFLHEIAGEVIAPKTKKGKPRA